MIINYEQTIEKIKEIAIHLYPNLPYHNFNHAIDVLTTARNYAIELKLPKNEIFLLDTATILHDALYKLGDNYNEERSIGFTEGFLPGFEYDISQIKRISNMILSTKMPQRPTSFLEEILCDSDLDNLGREDCLDKGEKLREELGMEKNKGWYQSLLNFLSNHKYHTKIAQEMRNPGKEKNIKKIKEILTCC